MCARMGTLFEKLLVKQRRLRSLPDSPTTSTTSPASSSNPDSPVSRLRPKEEDVAATAPHETLFDKAYRAGNTLKRFGFGEVRSAWMPRMRRTACRRGGALD